MIPYKFIAIEGNIGAGKTTLATRMAKHYKTELILEAFAENPFLPLFYENKVQYALPLELSFLSERFEQMLSISKNNTSKNKLLITDYVFQKTNLFAEVNLSSIEFELYKKIANSFNTQLPQPELIIYLDAPIELLLSNIKKRGRAYEQQIDADYLEKINASYQLMLAGIPSDKIIRIDMSCFDFKKEENFKELIFRLENHHRKY